MGSGKKTSQLPASGKTRTDLPGQEPSEEINDIHFELSRNLPCFMECTVFSILCYVMCVCLCVRKTLMCALVIEEKELLCDLEGKSGWRKYLERASRRDLLLSDSIYPFIQHPFDGFCILIQTQPT